ncbi:MAG: hypothetical protein JSR77_18355 [Planctomycetes bacterium]|nr:hypothetical protein [Planctomycetota bacterium]
MPLQEQGASVLSSPAASGTVREVELSLGRTAAPSPTVDSWGWIGLCGCAALVCVVWWWTKYRSTLVDPAEAAFERLARSLKLGRRARAEVRRIAAARGIAPVALLVSEDAWERVYGGTLLKPIQ